ncbi:hypothetical protein EUGRSUZ_H01026 [Eucalyptus grandis]|uniref:Uncharacterized protein n=2 Tax=Eucalyptus grandis TaxID=71139 RepID=A0ACC3JQC5_EUCGR|nr:hypothetical protein EUGRSUZ_H01026 [Eucalyptus grandis]
MLSSFKFHQESLSTSPSHKLRFCTNFTNFLSLSPQLSKLSSATEQASLIATTGRSDSFQASLWVIYSTTLHRSSRIGRSFPQLELPLILKQPKIAPRDPRRSSRSVTERKMMNGLQRIGKFSRRKLERGRRVFPGKHERKKIKSGRVNGGSLTAQDEDRWAS